MAKDERLDLDMLVALDESLLDDELVGLTIRPTIIQSQSDPEDVISFVISTLRHRLPQFEILDGRFPVSDLHGLSPRAWHAVVDIVCDLLERNQPSKVSPVDAEPLSMWRTDAYAILVSVVVDYPIKRMDLWTLFGDVPQLSSVFVGPRAFSRIMFQRLWIHFQGILPKSEGNNPVKLIFFIHRGQHCNSQCRHQSSLEQARDHLPSLVDQHAIHDILFDSITMFRSSNDPSSSDLTELLSAVIVWLLKLDRGSLQYDSEEFIRRFFACFCQTDKEDEPIRGIMTSSLAGNIFELLEAYELMGRRWLDDVQCTPLYVFTMLNCLTWVF